MPYSFMSSFQGFSLYAHAWNHYQGLSPPFNTSLGGNFIGYQNFSIGVGQTLIFYGKKVHVMVEVFLQITLGNLVPSQIQGILFKMLEILPMLARILRVLPAYLS